VYFHGGMSVHGRPKKDQHRKRRNFENGKLTGLTGSIESMVLNAGLHFKKFYIHL